MGSSCRNPKEGKWRQRPQGVRSFPGTADPRPSVLGDTVLLNTEPGPCLPCTTLLCHALPMARHHPRPCSPAEADQVDKEATCITWQTRGSEGTGLGAPHTHSGLPAGSLLWALSALWTLAAVTSGSSLSPQESLLWDSSKVCQGACWPTGARPLHCLPQLPRLAPCGRRVSKDDD